MSAIYFRIDDNLKALVRHALESRRHCPSLEHLYDPSFWKNGYQVPEGQLCAEVEGIDHDKIKASLVFVKDQGVYLMSSGLPGIGEDYEPISGGTVARHLVVYAHGYHPSLDKEWYERALDTLGGDDFSEHLRVEAFVPLIAKYSHIKLTVTETHVTVQGVTLKKDPPIRAVEALTWPCDSCRKSVVDEWYMVQNSIWENFGTEKYLCIGCLEDRLGRQLTQEDFTEAPVNSLVFGNKSERLRNRLSTRLPGRLEASSSEPSKQLDLA